MQTVFCKDVVLVRFRAHKSYGTTNNCAGHIEAERFAGVRTQIGQQLAHKVFQPVVPAEFPCP